MCPACAVSHLIKQGRLVPAPRDAWPVPARVTADTLKSVGGEPLRLPPNGVFAPKEVRHE
ncbi:hypothetical protein GCM10027575_20780 [Phytohabitans suffuscus]